MAAGQIHTSLTIPDKVWGDFFFIIFGAVAGGLLTTVPFRCTGTDSAGAQTPLPH